MGEEYTYDDAKDSIKRAYDKFFLICTKKYLKNPNDLDYSVSILRIAPLISEKDLLYLTKLLIKQGAYMLVAGIETFYISRRDLERWMNKDSHEDDKGISL